MNPCGIMYLQKYEITENMPYILVSSKQPPFAFLPLSVFSVSFMRLTPEMGFIAEVCLVRVLWGDFLPHYWGWCHQLCCAEVSPIGQHFEFMLWPEPISYLKRTAWPSLL